jgi:hypothetical protein
MPMSRLLIRDLYCSEVYSMLSTNSQEMVLAI